MININEFQLERMTPRINSFSFVCGIQPHISNIMKLAADQNQNKKFQKNSNK